MRIDPRTGNGLPGNPFFDAANPKSTQSRIWAYGMRNPFRFAINPSTQLPYVGDVGWNTYESLMIATPGANFGWPCVEGEKPVPAFASAEECKSLAPASIAKKQTVYQHAGINASVTAGDFVTGTNFPAEWRGDFIFADYSQQFIKRATLNATGQFTSIDNFANEVGEPVQLTFGPDGALYYLSIYSGGFRRIVRDGAPLGTLGALTQTVARTLPTATIHAPFDGDTFLPGTNVLLTGKATNATTSSWRITRYDGRRGTVITNTPGTTTTLVVPNDLGDASTSASFIEAIFTAANAKGEVSAAKINLYAPHRDGYIRSWWLMGGFPGRTLDDEALPGGEANYSPKQGDPLAWAYRSPTRNINFLKLISPNYKTVAYAFVWIDSPDDRTGLLGMNSDDGLAAWLNGKEIWRNRISRFMPDDTRDIDLPPIKLKKGLNALLIKVDTNDGDWQFKARVLNPDGSIMRDVTTKMSVP